jgi:hypothetical protein
MLAASPECALDCVADKFLGDAFPFFLWDLREDFAGGVAEDVSRPAAWIGAESFRPFVFLGCGWEGAFLFGGDFGFTHSIRGRPKITPSARCLKCLRSHERMAHGALGCDTIRFFADTAVFLLRFINCGHGAVEQLLLQIYKGVQCFRRKRHGSRARVFPLQPLIRVHDLSPLFALLNRDRKL